jgi:Reverse transcriptase (RNA-dependent DNA polymerase)
METFVPVAMHTSICILFTIVAVENLEIYQMDVGSAFLVEDIDEAMYINLPC